jgi:iron(III) transport system permease protein
MEYVGVMLNTVAVAGVSSILIVFGAIFVSYSARIFPYGINKYSGKIASLGYALPGAVIGVGILILFSSIDNWLIAKFNFESMLIGGTVFALIFGYCARFFAVAINTVDGSFERIGITVNKAARSLGASHIKTLLKIELPLMKRAMLFAFVLAFVDIVKELPLTLILRPFNYETLATKTYEMVGSQMMYESSIYVLSIMVAAFIPLFLTILKKEY